MKVHEGVTGVDFSAEQMRNVVIHSISLGSGKTQSRQKTKIQIDYPSDCRYCKFDRVYGDKT